MATIDQSKLLVGQIYNVRANDCCLDVAFTAMFMGYEPEDMDGDGKLTVPDYQPITTWDVEGLKMRASAITDWDEGDSWW